MPHASQMGEVERWGVMGCRRGIEANLPLGVLLQSHGVEVTDWSPVSSSTIISIEVRTQSKLKWKKELTRVLTEH